MILLSASLAGIISCKMKCQYWALLLLVARAAAPQALPGTAPLTDRADLAAEMVDGINEYLLRATAESIPKRSTLWNRNDRSADAHESAVAKNRERFKKIIGAVDTRLPVTSLTSQETTATKALVASGQHYKVYCGALAGLRGHDAPRDFCSSQTARP